MLATHFVMARFIEDPTLRFASNKMFPPAPARDERESEIPVGARKRGTYTRQRMNWATMKIGREPQFFSFQAHCAMALGTQRIG